MSHFTLLVELPAGTPSDAYESKISELMERYDENRDVPVYRSYWENATPQEHWSFEHVRESSKQLPTGDVTWRNFVIAYNEVYRSDGEDPLLYDPERDLPYELSTYNPDSKWDWWCVGGRWRGYFTAVAKMSSDDIQRVVLSGPRWMNEGRDVHERACDGGPIRLLDLEFQRLEAERKAIEYADKYDAAIVGTPEPIIWSEALSMFESVDEVRTFYREQPRVIATRELSGFMGSAIDDFQWGRELYIRRAVAGAVPGYAYLTQDGDWLAPGEMGWFGMSSDSVESRDAYHLRVNGRIASVEPDTVLILVDCHI